MLRCIALPFISFLFSECHDFEGKCLKPGERFDDHCMTFECQSNGKLERVAARKFFY